MRRKGFFRGALWALLIGNIFQLIYTLHDGQANRTIYLGWNQYLFYAGAACLLFPDFDNASPYPSKSCSRASNNGLMASCCGVVYSVSV